MANQPSIAEDILSYLIDNPDAQDTLEGIAEWWLLEHCLKTRLPAIQRAVEELTEEGLLVTRQGYGQAARFRINRERRLEIRRMLES